VIILVLLIHDYSTTLRCFQIAFITSVCIKVQHQRTTTQNNEEYHTDGFYLF